MAAAHYHDSDATPITGGWACYCDDPATPERPVNWSEIRSDALRRELAELRKCKEAGQ